MGKAKDTEFTEYNVELLDEEEDIVDLDFNDEDKEFLLEELNTGYKRTWRDTEKYKELRELHKIINDDLYIGFDEDEFQGLDGQ